MQQTCLFEEHIRLDARMVPFGGWSMPVQYEGILAEYQHTRKAVSVFDISHMGEFVIEGDAQASGLDAIVTMSIKTMPIKSCRYGAILNAQGGVIDDLIVFRLMDKKWFVVVNGATTAKDATHFQKHLKERAVFRDVSLSTGKIDVQGPLARDVLSALAPGVETLEYYTFDHFYLLGEHVLISRTGYTGELGYEIYYPWDKTLNVWQALIADDRVKPAGLGARDLLRIEMGYSLYGHELSEEISPLEAGLTRFVDFNKSFYGKEALEQQRQQGVLRKIKGFISSSRRSPRADHQIFSSDRKVIGVVTSGAFSPYLNRGIGIGFIQENDDGIGQQIFFGDNKHKFEAVIARKPFYTQGSLKD